MGGLVSETVELDSSRNILSSFHRCRVAQYDLRNLCLYIWLPALWAKPTVKKPSTTLAVIDIALDYQLSVLYGTFLHQGNIGKVLVAFLWLICKLGWFATMYCMWNETAQHFFSYKSYYQGVHQNLRYGCIVCDNFQKASKTMQFHKGINHKNS